MQFYTTLLKTHIPLTQENHMVNFLGFLRIANKLNSQNVKMAVLKDFAFWSNHLDLWLFIEMRKTLKDTLQDSIGHLRKREGFFINNIDEKVEIGYSDHFFCNSKVIYCPQQDFDPETDVIYRMLQNIYGEISWYVGDGTLERELNSFDILIAFRQGVCNQHLFRTRVKLLVHSTHEYWNKELIKLSPVNFFYWPNSGEHPNRQFMKSFLKPLSQAEDTRCLIKNVLPMNGVAHFQTKTNIKNNIIQCLEIYELYNQRNFEFLYTPGILRKKGRVVIKGEINCLDCELISVEFNLLNITYEVRKSSPSNLVVSSHDLMNGYHEEVINPEDFWSHVGRQNVNTCLLNHTNYLCQGVNKENQKIKWIEIIQAELLELNEDLSRNRERLKNRLASFVNATVRTRLIFERNPIEFHSKILSEYLIVIKKMMLDW
jgi:hypothetical protein